MIKHKTFAHFLQSKTINIHDVFAQCRMSDPSIEEIYSGKRLPSFKEIFELARAIEESPLTIIKVMQLDSGDYFDLKEEVSTINLLGYHVSHDDKEQCFDFLRVL